MGLSRRGIGVAIVAVGLLALGVLARPPVTDPEPTNPLVDRFTEQSSRLNHAVSRWSAAAVLDAARAGSPRSGWPADSLVVVFSGFAPSDSTQGAEQLLRRRWQSIERPDASVRVVVSVYNTESYIEHDRVRGPYRGTSVARSDSGIVCTAIIGGWLASRNRVRVPESTLGSTMGPCLLLTTFGIPGKAVDTWLAGNRFVPARSNAWLDRPQEFLDGDRGTPWYPYYDGNWSNVFSGGLSIILGQTVAAMLSPPYYIGSTGLRCLNGDRSSCVQGVLEPVAMRPGVPEDLTYSRGLSTRPRDAILSTHQLADWFVSDLIREHGRERFATFWKSDQPFEAAFRGAFGVDLGEWTEWWARRQYAGSWSFIESGQRAILGTNLETAWLPVVLAWTTLAVLIAASTARRRQVT